MNLQSCKILVSTSRDKRVRSAKDHGEKFQNKLASSFSVISIQILTGISIEAAVKNNRRSKDGGPGVP